MQAGAQQEATGHELEEMQLSLSAVKQERDELQHLLNSTSSAHHKQNASPGQSSQEARQQCCTYLTEQNNLTWSTLHAPKVSNAFFGGAKSSAALCACHLPPPFHVLMC